MNIPVIKCQKCATKLDYLDNREIKWIDCDKHVDFKNKFIKEKSVLITLNDNQIEMINFISKHEGISKAKTVNFVLAKYLTIFNFSDCKFYKFYGSHNYHEKLLFCLTCGIDEKDEKS
ncbi:MAG: hypothetical protein KFW07_03175 [Mycoplasmataceae bacterium]|nr:hypothetical protein [Mycoplasmataceae bacterium]